MLKQIIGFFYSPGTNKIHKEKVISIIILTIGLIVLLVYGKSRNKRLDAERISNARFTIGTTIHKYKNIRSPNPTVKYMFVVDGNEVKDFQEIPNYLHGKIVTEGGRYYVQFSSKNINNCELLLEHPVPDSVKEAPAEGWDYMPGYEHSK